MRNDNVKRTVRSVYIPSNNYLNYCTSTTISYCPMDVTISTEPLCVFQSLYRNLEFFSLSRMYFVLSTVHFHDHSEIWGTCKLMLNQGSWPINFR